MDTLYIALTIFVIIPRVNSVSSFCFPACSCTNDTLGRTLLCMETALRRIPENIPQDFIKIRIENSHLTEIPRGSFNEVSALEFLWLNFNNITVMNIKSLEGLKSLTELRLQGNKLRSVPWTAFLDTPNLKILDLKHNRLDVLPEYALRHLPALTYLDLSFNQLTVVSRDVFLNWPIYPSPGKQGKREETTTVVVALHDNPWLCDCRLKGLVEFIKSVSSPIILMNSYLTCSGPEFRSGKFFHEIELKTCMKPVATAPETNLTLQFGSNATLFCLVKARPDPTVRWTYGLKFVRRFAESQTRVDEETVRSQLTIPALNLAVGGVYTCTANNFIGNSSVSILVNVNSQNVSMSLSPASPLASADENVYIDIRIAKQTVYGITLEWHAAIENPAETWYTIHFGRFDAAKKEMVYIGPGINSYSVTDLLPVTKYEICVTLKSQAPRNGQCVVFVTGSDISELEQREKLIHIIVIVCAMVLAVPAGMYACTTETRFSCFDRCIELCRKRRRKENTPKPTERQGTFDSLQAASDEGLCKDSSEDKRPPRRSDDKTQKSKFTAELY